LQGRWAFAIEMDPLGRMKETYPEDKDTRTALIRTPTGKYKRPAVKLCILPLDNDSNEGLWFEIVIILILL